MYRIVGWNPVAQERPAEPPKNVLCVSHGGCISVMLDDVCQLEGLDDILPIKNTSVTVVNVTSHRGGWVCKPGAFVNDTSHLDDEASGRGAGKGDADAVSIAACRR